MYLRPTMRKKIMHKGKIGVFDSGIGGLTVLKEIIKELPHQDIIYFGDGKRAPYGTKSKETIEMFALQSMKFLTEKGADTIVIACNTVSSNAIDIIKKNYPHMPIVEVISTTANLASKKTMNKKIGVIGTVATVDSLTYEKALMSIDSEIQVFQKACPLFVPLAEEGLEWWNDDITRMVAARYFKAFEGIDIDTLVLGCTHYPLLKKAIGETIGEHVVLVDSASVTAKDTKALLKSLGKLSSSKEEGKLEIYTSDSIGKFMNHCEAILGDCKNFVKKSDIGE